MKRLFKGLILCILCLPLMVGAKEYGKMFSKVTKDGTYTVNVATTEDGNVLENVLNTAIMYEFNGDYSTYYVYSELCLRGDPDWNLCTLPDKDQDGYYNVEVHIGNIKTEEEEIETLKVKYDSSKVDNSIKEIIDGVKTKMDMKKFFVEDLGYISFINSIKANNVQDDYLPYAGLFSNEFQELIGNNNILINTDLRAGDGEPWRVLAFGFTSLFYDGVGYATLNESGPILKQVLYIPDDTEETDEAYIAAALKRIEGFMGKDHGMTITKKNTISAALDFDDHFDWEHASSEERAIEEAAIKWKYIDSGVFAEYYGGMTGKLDSIYEVTTKVGNKFYILIERNSEKMTTPLFSLKDINTKIKINTSDGNIPLDTTIKAMYVTEGDEYNKIKDKIKGNFTAVDLDLFSHVSQENITKTTNGKFKVSIPVPENLNGKKIYVYYITSTGELEEHEATVENGYATFETDHFSTYILAEKQTDNPKTGDYIINYVILLSIAVIGVFITKKEVNE